MITFNSMFHEQHIHPRNDLDIKCLNQLVALFGEGLGTFGGT